METLAAQAIESQADLRRALERAAFEWRSTFDALGLPIVIVDFGGTVRRINRAARDLFGADYREIVGRTVTELGEGQGEPWAALAGLVQRLLGAAGPAVCETRDLRGSTWELEASLSVGPAPEDARVIVQVRDISRTVRLQEELRRTASLAVRGGRGRRSDASGELRPDADPFLGDSPAVRAYAREAALALRSEGPILIQGETGSGKGVLARWLRANGPRREGGLVDLNCAGLSREFLESELFGHARGAFTGAVAAKPGLFEAAHSGTLFLDEIGDLDPAVQPKVLKALEEKRFRRMGEVDDRRVDVLLIAATNHDLLDLVRAGRFRSDLYFRISTIPLAVPPLRERLDDLPLLAGSLLSRLGRELGRPGLTLLPEALAALQGYAWPGNLRELRNVLERAALRSESGAIGRADLRFAAPPSGPSGRAVTAGPTLAEVEQARIEAVLGEERGRVVAAARRLGIPRSTLYQRIRELRIDLSRLQAREAGA